MHKTDGKATGWAVWGAIGWIAAASAVAQTEETGPVPDPSRAFHDRIEVQVIEVEVVVTDERGQRVTGLTRKDFELYLGDEPIAIEYFDEVREGTVRRAGDSAIAEATGETEEADRPGVPRSFLIFIDEFFSYPLSLKPVLDRLETQLDILGPEDRVAVVQSLGGSLRVYTDWTADRDRILGAFQAVRSFPRGLVPALDRGGVSESFGVLLDIGIDPGTSRFLYRAIQRATNAATTALWSFADTPGRKVFILVSGGWPYEEAHPWGSIAFAGDLEHLLEFGKWGGVGLLRPVIESANLLGWTVYPVLANDVDAGSRWASLWSVARRTGGQISGGPTNPRPLDTMFEDLRSYYVLGFTQQGGEDGDSRRLRVEVPRRGLATRHRKDLRNPSEEFRLAMERERGLLEGPWRSELQIVAGTPERRERQVVEVPFVVQVPLDHLTRVPTPQGSESATGRAVAVATATLHIQAMSLTSGRRSDPVSIRLELPEQVFERNSAVGYEFRLNLRPTRNRIVVSLEDETTGKAQFGTIDLDLRR